MYLEKRHVSLAMAYFSAFISTYNLQFTLDLPAKMLLPAKHFLNHFHMPDKRLKRIVRNCVGLTYLLVFFHLYIGSGFYYAYIVWLLAQYQSCFLASSTMLIIASTFGKTTVSLASLEYVQWNPYNQDTFRVRENFLISGS